METIVLLPDQVVREMFGWCDAFLKKRVAASVGVAVSYGTYDPQANRGHIVVGTSRDTSQFAGDALALWWKREGSNRYPDADRLPILADCGGSNSNRVAAWECALQRKLCDAFDLRVTVAHYPPGTSKWNRYRAPPLQRDL